VDVGRQQIRAIRPNLSPQCTPLHPLPILYIEIFLYIQVPSLTSVRQNVLYDPEMIQPLKPLTVLEAAAGRAHTLVRTKEGLVFSFGNTEFGQLGHGTAADQVRAAVCSKRV
jgi:hypothetical protein